MLPNDKKVIGYIASYSRTEVLFVGDACLIMGSEKQLLDHISRYAPEHATKLSLKKIRFGDIVHIINNGEKFLLDEESFGRFFPLGKQIGFELDDSSYSNSENSDSKFYLLSRDGLITTPPS